MSRGLGSLEIYKSALRLSDMAWHIVETLPKPYRFGMGMQLLNATDSIGANIAEGYGRFHYKDSLKFYYNARGSLWETKHWIWLLHKRRFVNRERFDTFLSEIETLGKQLNVFIGRLRNVR